MLAETYMIPYKWTHKVRKKSVEKEELLVALHLGQAELKLFSLPVKSKVVSWKIFGTGKHMFCFFIYSFVFLIIFFPVFLPFFPLIYSQRISGSQ